MERPAWFVDSLVHRPTDHVIYVNDTKIHYLRYDTDRQTSKQLLLFVHGGWAHAHWWDFIAPFFCEEYAVVAVDMSGHGESDHLDSYSRDSDLAHLQGVIQDTGVDSQHKPVIVGHSRGGFVALHLAREIGEQLGGVVILDSFVRPPEIAMRPPPTNPNKRWYSTKQELLSRFRLSPPQDCSNEFLVSYIASHSVAKEPEGFTWKFDKELIPKEPELQDPNFPVEASQRLRCLKCRAGLFYGTRSAFFADEATVKYMNQELRQHPPGGVPSKLVPIIDAGHHMMLDQPIAVITAIATLLTQWTSPGGAAIVRTGGAEAAGEAGRQIARPRL
jgi:pimeloyl-ACP methyl ester carboxylesterase